MTLLLINVLIAVIWVFLWGELNVWTLLIGLFGGYAILWLFTRVQGDGGVLRRAYGQRVIDLCRFAGHFARLLVVSNLQIAREILTPGNGLSPRIVRYDVTGMTPAEVATLSNAITLTPGTLVTDVRDRRGGPDAAVRSLHVRRRPRRGSRGPRRAAAAGAARRLWPGGGVTALGEAVAWSGELVRWTATAGLVVIGVSVLLCLYRVVRGPTLADRATAADALGVQVIGFVILFIIRSGSLLFVDGMLILSLLGFAGTVAAAQFIARPHVPPTPGVDWEAADDA